MLKKNQIIKIFLGSVLILIQMQVKSQDTLNPFRIKYSDNPLLNQKYNKAPYLPLPSTFGNDINYDFKTQSYVITPKAGRLKLSNPYLVDFEEYNQQRNKQFLSENWKTYSLKQETKNPLDDFLNPQLQIGVKGLDKIFGSDQITITPSGSFDLSLGFIHYKNENGSLTPTESRNTNFDFTQNIQIGVNGKVGTKLDVGINYNTQSMFEFENKKKVEYTGEEDEIIQKIEFGDVQFSTTNSLISGSSTLFGIRTDLKFGKFLISSLLSQQKGQSKTIEVKGSSVETEFEIQASDYQEDQHFFLSHFFRDNYEKSLENLPIINSGIKITKIEVWVTNKTSDYENSRNIAGFIDLGENKNHIFATSFVMADPYQLAPFNKINNLYDLMNTTYSEARDFTKLSATFSSIIDFIEGRDFCKLENARKLKETEYNVNTSLGYISLRSRLRPGEILAVAYEYTLNGKTYQVGEFTQDVQSPQTLYLKLLRGPSSTPNLPTWDLMMKNIYYLSTSQISNEKFALEILYNNDRAGTKINYIPEGNIKNKRLLTIFNFDNTDAQLNANPDGFFDFMEGITIDSRYGLLIFPMLEPFGTYLENQIGNGAIANKYTYKELYDSTQYIAKQRATKNKFYFKGKYKSSSGSEIMLNAFNIPQGSVVVTQGGNKLTENVDYTVDYNIGRVTIINQSLLNSGIPIKISLESNEMWGMTQKTLIGTNITYNINKKLNIGGTFLHLSELPAENKTSFGFEPISNSIYGFNLNYSTKSNFITQIVDLMPFLQTKEKSVVNLTAEFAQLLPHYPSYIRKEYGVNGVTFIDPFEQSQNYIDVTSITGWSISSIPQGQPQLFPEASDLQTINSGLNRALLSWYMNNTDILTITGALKIPYLTKDDLSNHQIRIVYETELFPNKQNINNMPALLNMLNIAYFPSEKGPYNFDVNGVSGISSGMESNGQLKNPRSRWAGIMRSLYVTDFESSNISFLEFWLMDPFIYDQNNSGDIYINLGDISEDILLDGRKSFENGIISNPTSKQIDTTQWGLVSNIQIPTQNFDYSIIAKQDVGYDGLNNAVERTFFQKYLQSIAQTYGVNSKAYQQAIKDPANDDFEYFVANYYDSLKSGILERYKRVNMPEGNSTKTELDKGLRAYSLTPDREDINGDNTLDNYEAYYQYKIHLDPNEMEVGKNYIVNKIVTKAVNLQNGDKDQTITWYQFKIPIRQPQSTIGQINGFKSIRFMRIFLKDFENPTTMRFTRLRFVSDQWRLYEFNITEGGEGTIYPQPQINGNLDITNVSIEEHNRKTPVNYIMPPGVLRPRNLFDQGQTKENEQSMSMIVNQLPDGESKAIYKSIDMDFRKFKRLQMHVHAEAPINQEGQTKDYDLNLFVRIGSDFTENYYEYEIPLKLTPHGFYQSGEEDTTNSNRYIVWPTENKLDILLQKLVEIKVERNKLMTDPKNNVSFNQPFIKRIGKNNIKVIGNPSLENVKSMMIGIRNPRRENNYLTNDDGTAKSAEVWINELRLADYDNVGGWAANIQMNTTLADFGNLSVSGYMHTPGFGSIEKRVNERYEDLNYEYNISSQFQLGRFFKKDYGISLPLFFGFSQSYSTPSYNPFDTDVDFYTAVDYLPDEQKNWLKNASQTFVQRKSINLSNISMKGKINKTKKSQIIAPWHIANFNATIAFNETYTSSPTIEYNYEQSFNYGFNYNWAPNAKVVEPFKKSKFLQKKAFQIIKDFNFYWLPTRVNFTTQVNRNYITFRNRQLMLEDFQLPASFQKNFLWSRNYDLSYKITNNLKADFSINSQSRIEPDGWTEQESIFQRFGIQQPKDTIFLFLNDFGKNTDYKHNLRLNYIVPINKLPLLKWTNLTTNYTGTYDWRRGQEPITIPATDTTPEYSIYFGNIIQNSATINADLNLNFATLYRNIKFLKDIDQRFNRSGRKPIKTEKKEETYTTSVNIFKNTPRQIIHGLKTETIKNVEAKTEDGQIIKVKYQTQGLNKISITSDTTLKNISITITGVRQLPESPLIIVRDYFFRSMMMLRSISLSYKNNSGTLINGYLPETSYLGGQNYNNLYAPGWLYLAGWSQKNIVETFAKNGWLTKDTLFNMPMNYVNGEEIRGRASIEPFNNVRIDLNFQRSLNINKSVYGRNINDNFIVNTRTLNGNFIMSVNTIISSFDKIDSASQYQSKYYNQFLENRLTVAQRYAQNRANLDPNYNPNDIIIDSSGIGYPRGYNGLQQEVLTASFLSAYSGISPNSIWLEFFPLIPIPDWRISFDGLGNLPFIKKFVEKVTINHSYSSSYSLNSFTNNSNFNFDLFNLSGFSDAIYTTNGNFIPQYEASGVLISEKFVPFIGIDIKWKGTLSTRFEYKRSRDLFLSFSNSQIRQRHTNGLTIGSGYTIKNLAFKVNVEGQTQDIKSDLNLRLDITINNNIEIYRKIIEQINNINTQQYTFDLTFTADYNISNNLNLQLYFNDNFMRTNTSAPVTNSKGGIKVRYTFR